MTYYKTSNLSVARQKGKITLSLAILFGIVLLIFVYLAQVNKTVAQNFELRAAQNSLKQLQDSNQQLSISLMEACSLDKLENVAKDSNLVAIEKADYLKTISSFFALSQKP